MIFRSSFKLSQNPRRSRRLATFGLGLMFLAMTSASSAVAARKMLNFSNLSTETQQAIIKRFPQIQKEKLSLEQADDLIRFLHSNAQFDQVQILDDGSSEYKIYYTRTRKIASVHFKGLTAFSESEARNFFTVKAGDAFDQDLIIENGEALRQAYRDLGYQNAVIDIELPNEASGDATAQAKEAMENVAVLVSVTENKRTHIASIDFSSPNEDLNKILGKALLGWVGDPLTDVSLSEIQKRARDILTKKHYARTDIIGPDIRFSSDESQAQLTFRLDKVFSYDVRFEGNRQETTSIISRTLDLDNFYTANPNIGPELANKVRNLYLSRGYARVEVTNSEMDGKKNFERKVILNIEEGPKIKIQKIVVGGRISREPEYYEKFLRKNTSPLVSSGYYNKEDIETGYKNLVLYLQNEGFLLSKIISTRTQYNREKTQVTLVVNLDEGPLTQIESISFEGNSSYPAPTLLEVTKLHSTGALKLNEIEASVTNLKNFYHEQGYIEMQLLNEKEDLVTYDETNTRARLNFKIVEGPKVTVASIVLEGNNFTKDYVILNELEMRQGDVVTPSKIDESKARLQRTGFFGSVEVKTLEEKTNVANRTLLVKVTEREPGLFNLGAGATSERTFTIRGYTGVSYRNLWGTGRGLSLRLEGNYNVTEVKYLEHKETLGYLEPYLFNTRVRGRVNISRSKAVTDYGMKQTTELNETTYSLEKDFTSHIMASYKILSIGTYKQESLDNDTYPLSTTSLDIATTGPAIDFDFRDNPFNPTSGTYTRLNAEYASPKLLSSPQINFIRSTASVTHYLKLSDGPLVWANNVQGGYLRNLSTVEKGGVPYDIKGFILGGQDTVRGFQAGTEDVFPNKADLGLGQNPTQAYTLTTSARMFLLKSELRFPVYGPVGGAVFYDGGSISIEDLDLGDNYRDSVGASILVGTPVGPVNLTWAYKLDRRSGEAPIRFYFSIGTF